MLLASKNAILSLEFSVPLHPLTASLHKIFFPFYYLNMGTTVMRNLPGRRHYCGLMHGAVCGGPTDTITVYDYLDGTCAWGPSEVPTTGLLLCSGQIYSRQCPGFAGSLILVFFSGDPYSPSASPDMQNFLETLGLGSVTYVGQLSVLSPNNSAAPISPHFLPSLTVIGGDLSILQSQTVTTSIVALPGLAAIRQVGGSVLLGGYDNLDGPLFSDLTSLAGLECVGLQLTLSVMPLLTSTAGLEKLSVVNYNSTPGGTLIDIFVTAIATPAALAPLSLVANCTGGPAFGVSIGLNNCRSALSSSTALCTYISSGVC